MEQEVHEIEKCPYCGGTEFALGEQSGFGGTVMAPAWKFAQTPIIHRVCLNCGTVVRSYVLKPEKLRE